VVQRRRVSRGTNRDRLVREKQSDDAEAKGDASETANATLVSVFV
jgi:hypothetical protein